MPPGRGSASYTIVLGLLIVAVAVSVLAPTSVWTNSLVVALEGLAVFLVVNRSGARTRILLIPVASLAVLGIILIAASDRALHLAANGLSALLLLALPAAVVVRFRRDLYVTGESVLGAVSVYLVIGLLFAIIDSSLSEISAQPFFAQAGSGSTSDYTYFSFITLSTVGYGDLTPAPALARFLAMSEALMGQLYLVTVIALVVGNMGRERRVSNTH